MLIFGARIRGRYFNAVAADEATAQMVLWRQASASFLEPVYLDEVAPALVWRSR